MILDKSEADSTKGKEYTVAFEEGTAKSKSGLLTFPSPTKTTVWALCSSYSSYWRYQQRQEG